MSRTINYLLVSLTLSMVLCTILMLSTYSRPSIESYKNGRFWRAPIVERNRIKQVLTRAPEYYVVEEPIITEDQNIQIDIVELNEGIIFLSPAKLDETDNIPLLNSSPEQIIEFEKLQNENSIDPLQNKETSIPSIQESTTEFLMETTTEELTSESTTSFPDVETTKEENEISNNQNTIDIRNDQNYAVYHQNEEPTQVIDDPCYGLHAEEKGFFDVVWCLGHKAYNYVKSVASYLLGY